MLSIKLFRLVFCLVRNIENLCFGIEVKQLKQTVSKQTKITNRKTLNSLKKIQKLALYQTVSFALLFVSVQSKRRNSLFWYRSKITETKVFVSDSAVTRSVPVSAV
jgi:hypothetical protein